jgi:hypothetical protein
MDFWLELVVGDKILSPRTKLTAQAYALHSRIAEDIEKKYWKFNTFCNRR